MCTLSKGIKEVSFLCTCFGRKSDRSISCKTVAFFILILIHVDFAELNTIKCLSYAQEAICIKVNSANEI